MTKQESKLSTLSYHDDIISYPQKTPSEHCRPPNLPFFIVSSGNMPTDIHRVNNDGYDEEKEGRRYRREERDIPGGCYGPTEP